MNRFRSLRALRALRPFFVLLVAAFFCAPPSDAFCQSESNAKRGKSYALLFGVATFENFGALPGAVNDMLALREEWFDGPEFEDAVFALVEGADGENALAPTRANFERSLDELSRLTTDADVLYVCVATHGVAAFSRSFLCPQDAVDGDLSEATRENLDEIARQKGLISVASILDKLERTPGRKALILDACRENASTDAETDFLKEFEDRLRESAHANLAVISSCCLGQFAQEIRTDDGRRRGLFFSAFLEGLNGNAELTGAYDGQITLIEAYNYANQQTKRRALEEFEYAQTPELYEANDADAPNGVDRLVLTQRNLFAQTLDAPTLAQESDALFAIRVGDALTKAQPELSRGAKGDYPLIEKLFDYALQVQPSNRLARNLRGYSRRAQGDYAGALEDFAQIGAELVLYAQADPKEPLTARLNACLVYNSATATRRREGAAFQFGTVLIVDKIQNGRCRVAAWNSKPTKSETWVSVDAVAWSRPIAETAIVGSEATPTRNVNVVGSNASSINSMQRSSSPISDSGGSFTPATL